MSDLNKSTSRRRFLRTGLALGAALPVVIGTARTASAELPMLETSDPSAQALKYAPDANTVDAATRGGSDRICGNCRFYTGGPEAGPCQLFPGKAVTHAGWCAGWAAKG